jgi:hypothetical protein
MGTRKFLTTFAFSVLAFPPAGAAPATTFLIRLGGAQIGTLERTVERSESSGSIVRERTHIYMARGDRSVEMGEHLTWTEDSAEGLERFEAERTGFGPERWLDTIVRTHIGWHRSRSRGGAAVVDTIPSDRLSGPTEIDRLFAAGTDSLRIRTLDPTTSEPETYFASFVRADTLPSRDALVPCRLFVLRDSSGAAPEILQWRDRDGAIWKEVDPTLGWTSERSELAPGRKAEPALDVMRWMAIPLAGKPPRGDRCALVVESIDTGTRPRQAPPIPDGSGQKVLEGPDPGTWQILREPGPSPSAAPIERSLWAEDAELAAALRPGLIVDSGTEEIRAFADRAIGRASSPTAEALALERAVHDAIRTRDLATLMGTASQTLRDGRGDCTEHAVLLAASCRARGIPARLVAGIVPGGRQMSFHLWTEVYVGQWIPLDATRGVGSIDPCAVALQRWNQPEDGLAGFQLTLERLTSGYRFRFAED